jgi:hypothetical protein
MDLNTITEVLQPASADTMKEWQPGYASGFFIRVG